MATTAPSPSHPSEAVGQVMKRGRGRNKMHLVQNVPRTTEGTEEMGTFWGSAKTPKRKPLQDNRKSSSKASAADAKEATKKRAPRFSVGSNAEGSVVETEKANSFNKKLGAVSPGELSSVATEPPTPKEATTPEETRRMKETEEDEVVVKHSATADPVISPLVTMSPAAGNDDFPIDDDNDDFDDDDDLLPPGPPDSAVEEPVPLSLDDVDFPDANETSTPEKPATPVVVTKSQASTPPDFPMENDDDDDGDDDKEGDGFAMNSPPAQSVSSGNSTQSEPSEPPKKPSPKKRGRPKKVTETKTNKRKPSIERTEETTTKKKTPVRKKKKKNVQVTVFSPPGYPIGPREMKPIPVSDLKESPEEGVRRSRRARIPPLQFWKNERPVYGPHDEDGELGEEMGCMPVVKTVLTALETPRRDRKVTFSQLAARPAALNGEVVKEFNSSKLRKKYKILEGAYAKVWDEAIEDNEEMKVVSYARDFGVAELPLPPTRKKSEGKVVGRAAQAFNERTRPNDVTAGFISGSLVLPPKGIKDPESTGNCQQLFVVCTSQPKAIEVAFGDPQEDSGGVDPETCQRFLLSSGDQFRIPPGNSYRVVNHSTSTDAVLAWTIIRPNVAT